MLSYLLFIIYSTFFSWLLIQLKFVQKSAIPKKWIAILFLLKITAGCIYGYIHYQSNYGVNTDTWKFFNLSIPETEILKHDPIAFFKSVFSNGYANGGAGFLETGNSYWNDLKHNLMIMLMSFFNLLSNSNYYINIIFYNFITFLGIVALYRFCKQYIQIPSLALIITLFLFPSLLFWGSGFHKEGLLYAAIGFILYSAYKIIYGKKLLLFSLIFIFNIIGILLLRNYILLFFLPFLVIWIFLNYHKTQRTFVYYLMANICFVILFFNIGKINKSINLPQFMCNAQQEFLALPANTKITTDTLQPNLKGFMHNLPIAIESSILKPTIFEVSLTYMPALLENTVLLFLIVFSFYYFQKKVFNNNTLLLFLFFAWNTLLFLGYTVPITGAIIRYKSIVMPFLFLFIINMIRWEKVKWIKK